MKKRVFVSVLAVLVVCVCVALNFGSSEIHANEKSFKESSVSQHNTVALQAEENKNDKVLEARLLNMLNHNFAYNEDFDSVEDLVNCSTIALLDLKVQEEPFIEQRYVSDYLFDMYGIEVENFAEINTDFEHKEGYVYVVPKGYTIITHNATSLIKNEDGTITLKTEAFAESFDGEIETFSCETLFVGNNESQFGYNIVFSEMN